MSFARTFIPTLLLAAAAAPSFAAPPESGFYAGIGGGVTHYGIDYANQVDSAYAPTPFGVTDAAMDRTNGGTFRVTGGYQFNKYFGVEASYLDLGSATAHYTVDDGAGPNSRNAKYQLAGFNVSAVGTWPISDQFAALGKLGVFASTLKYSESGTDYLGQPYSFSAPNNHQTKFSYGLGAAYRLTDNVSLRFDWDRVDGIGNAFALTNDGNGRFDSVDMFTLSAVYRF